MTSSLNPSSTWRGWSGKADGDPGDVTSVRLSGEADVKNRLFPKIRSWFALGAPFELMSPLSVLRIIFALGIVAWPLATLIPSWPGVPRIDVLAVAPSGVLWVALLMTRSVSLRACQLMVGLWIVQASVLLGISRGSLLSLVAFALLIPIEVFAGLFLGFRSVLAGICIGWVSIVIAMPSSQGIVRSVVIATVASIAVGSAALVTLLLTRSARRQGAVDPDTGLPNGFGLSEKVAASFEGLPYAVVALSLEGLGDAREAMGYPVGTELLRRAVEDLGQVIPRAAVIGRVEGDELVVVAPLASTPEARDGGWEPAESLAPDGLAATLSQAISAGLFIVNEVEVSMRVFAGSAVCPQDGNDVAELVRRASLSARQAIAKGTSHLRWNGDQKAMAPDDLAMLSHLRLAADKGELWIAYQPQISTGSRLPGSVEALLRWNSPEHGQVPPGVFIPLAERTGLIDRLTDWVLGEALEAQVRWRASGLDIPVSVNLSAKTLTKPALAEWILSELGTRRIPPRSLVVEVTETAAATDLLLAVKLLQPLHDAGVEVSIDDFGVGYTSLAILPQLPLDELKVDMGFVQRSATSPADEAIVRSVCELAGRLGLRSVAEGVEDEECSLRMTSFGFDVLQGYHFSKPLPEAELLAYFNRDSSGSESLPAVS